MMNPTVCARCGEELNYPIMLCKDADGSDSDGPHPYGSTCAKIVLGIPRAKWSRSNVYYAVFYRFKGGDWKETRLGSISRPDELENWTRTVFEPALIKRSTFMHYEFRVEARIDVKE